MPFAKDGSSFRKHAYTEHTCKCGKIVKGNAFYNHAKTCPIYQEYINSRERETTHSLINPFGKFSNPT
jgi:hypothetical protein